MSYPPLLNRIGKKVFFSVPMAIDGEDQSEGVVKDCVMIDPVEDENWGCYHYFSELIEWPDGSKNVRLTYYYAPPGSQK